MRFVVVMMGVVGEEREGGGEREEIKRMIKSM